MPKAEVEPVLQQGNKVPASSGFRSVHSIKQKDVLSQADVNTLKKRFSLDLNQSGPYVFDYSRNGVDLLLGGKVGGHFRLSKWRDQYTRTEKYLEEQIRDVCFLRNYQSFAVAQQKYTYIYNNQGVEVHWLKYFHHVQRLQFLPFHFLLSGINKSGYLSYLDTSIGKLICDIKARAYDCTVMRQNKSNAVIVLGQTNGCVTFWSPNCAENNQPLLKLKCHYSPIHALAINHHRQMVVTCSNDNTLKIWDVRKLSEIVSKFKVWGIGKSSSVKINHITSMDFSDTEMLGLSYGNRVQTYKMEDILRFSSFKEENKKKKINSIQTLKPYAYHEFPRTKYRKSKLKNTWFSISRVRFCPFEDVLGVSHTHGFDSLVIPQSGLKNVDTYAANPFQTRNERRETEVKRLLDKIQPDMIHLETNFVGNLDTQERILRLEYERKQAEKEDLRIVLPHEREEKEIEEAFAEEKPAVRRIVKNKARKGRKYTNKLMRKIKKFEWKEKQMENDKLAYQKSVKSAVMAIGKKKKKRRQKK